MRHDLIDAVIRELRSGSSEMTFTQMMEKLTEYRAWAENLRAGNHDYAEENSRLRRELAIRGPAAQEAPAAQSPVKIEAIRAIVQIANDEPMNVLHFGADRS